MENHRCPYCREIFTCPHCGATVESFKHVGVRATGHKGSSIWHISVPCGHKVDIESGSQVKQGTGGLAVYNGGPVWKDGYQWFNVYWGSYWNGQNWVQMINKATEDLETNASYSGKLKQYGVGVGGLKGSSVISQDPPSTVSNTDIGKEILSWIKQGLVPDLQKMGAYNIFLPPGVSATLGTQQSCSVFCDYHDTADANNGPFFTCEPYPCSTGCNQCNTNAFDTLTQGLSEEMVELKTDMNPGTGWVIGNEEVCDYCDQHFVCNQISTGEFVNAWYSDATGTCWTPKS